MRVDLGLDLFTVSVLIGGGHYLGALIAIPFGHFSDTHPIAGYRRTVYVLLGALGTALVLVVSPRVALWLAGAPTLPNILLGFAFFLLKGVATYVAGTAYLALITDRTTPDERGQATGLVWTLLMVGIIGTGVGVGIAMREYAYDSLVALFWVGAGVSIALSLVALWRQEPRRRATVSRHKVSLAEALRTVVRNRDSRAFAVFLIVGHFSFFMYDVILEPFGGEVFGLSLAETTRFNAYLGLGLVGAMLFGGMWLIPRWGKRRVTALGCWIMVGAFAGLSACGLLGVSRTLPLVIALLGLGAGGYTVGGVALMMDMTISQHTGLLVGAWTLVQALARGPSSVVGGGLVSILVSWGATPGQAYGAVFASEAVGLLLAIVLLRRVVVERFHQSVESFGALALETLN
jgi:BCD family chlorophyll transporter-like MFS transporter